MGLTILSIAYPFTHVGPDASGGSEQILTALDRQLTAAGHRSLVIAVEGSELAGELVPSPNYSGELTHEIRRWGQRVHGRLILDTLNRHTVDLIHFHSLDFHAYLPSSSIPSLATLHLPVNWYPQKIFTEKRKHLFFNCVSLSQDLDCPASPRVLPFVRNGIDVGSFECQASKEPYVLGLGRICPEKGFHHALEAAKRADVPMLLAGELFPYAEHHKYFDQEIKPRLDARRRYIGPVGATKKRALLAAASALLVPSLVAETSSLVTMEALASGTPVVAFRIGAIPELIEENRTGFLVDNAVGMARAIKRATRLQPADCRQAAEAKCDGFQMGNRYMARYKKILRASEQTRSESYVHAGVSWLADLS